MDVKEIGCLSRPEISEYCFKIVKSPTWIWLFYDLFFFVSFSGSNFIHIVDYSKATNPAIVHKKEYKETFSDIQVCGSVVAFLIDGNPGRVDIFNIYNPEKPTLDLNATIPEGKYWVNCLPLPW